jgi:hypothetical protein
LHRAAKEIIGRFKTIFIPEALLGEVVLGADTEVYKLFA